MNDTTGQPYWFVAGHHLRYERQTFDQDAKSARTDRGVGAFLRPYQFSDFTTPLLTEGPPFKQDLGSGLTAVVGLAFVPTGSERSVTQAPDPLAWREAVWTC
jgi:hypothetical protein